MPSGFGATVEFCCDAARWLDVTPAIAAIKMVAAYRSQYDSDFVNVMPINLYGPGDNFMTPNTATSSPRYPPLS